MGALLSREEGKTTPEVKGDVYRARQFFTCYAAEVLRQMGDLCDSMRPVLFINGTNAMRSNREEVFGPVSCVTKAEDYDHALEKANDTEFGPIASIITQSLSRATHFRNTPPQAASW